MPRLDLRAVSRRFGAVRALEDVTLCVGTGEIVALLGESGCGKSTLLRVIAGLERADAGELRLDGRVVGSAVPPEARGIGMMFQDYALFPHLTVGENVRFGLARGADARALARSRLAQVGLAGREADYPGRLSGGECQRVALARALAPEPRILLLDEPFSNLDRRTGDRVRAETVALTRSLHISAILVTHDADEALIFADRIALMRAGRIVQVGTGEDLHRKPGSAFAVRMFGPCFEIAARVSGGRALTPFGPVPAAGLLDGAPCQVCLRPDALTLVPVSQGANARVVRRSYLGAHTVLLLSVDGAGSLLTLPVPHAEPTREGDRVRLALTGRSAFVFPSPAGDA